MSDDDKNLEELLSKAKARPPQVSDDLFARVIADADSVAMKRRATPSQATVASRPSIRAWFGGWPGLAGLTTATAAGIFIGFAAPQGVNTVAEAVSPTVLTEDFSPALATFTDFEAWSLEDG